MGRRTRSKAPLRTTQGPPGTSNGSQGLPNCWKYYKNQWFFNDFSSCLERLNTLLGSLWGSPRPPRSAPESPSIPQRPSRTPPGTPQGPPGTLPGHPGPPPIRPGSSQGPPRDAQGSPEDPPETPRAPARGQKSSQRVPRDAQVTKNEPPSYPEGGKTPTRVVSTGLPVSFLLSLCSSLWGRGQHTHARQVSFPLSFSSL